MEHAILRDNPEAVRGLHELGVPLDYPSGRGEDASLPWMHRAAVQESLKVMSGLLGEGISIEIADPEGMTPLMAAAENAKPRSVDFLLKHGADIHARNNRGFSAIEIGAMTNFINLEKDEKRVIDLLIQAGADPQKTNRYGHTLVDTANSNIREHLRGLGFTEGADAESGYTKLHEAARYGTRQPCTNC